MYGYIYLTHDSLNNKFYIGQHKWEKYEIVKYKNSFTESFEQSKGFKLFNIDPKYVGSGVYLKRAINKYGRKYFYVLDILAVAETKNELDDLEVEYIRYYRNLEYNLYNINNGGTGGTVRDLSGKNNPMYGKHLTDEHKQKISKALKGRKYGIEEYEAHKKARKPWKHTEETKQYLSKVATGRVGSRLGKVTSIEMREKISKTMKEIYKTEKGKQMREINKLKHIGKISYNKGKKFNKESGHYE